MRPRPVQCRETAIRSAPASPHRRRRRRYSRTPFTAAVPAPCGANRRYSALWRWTRGGKPAETWLFSEAERRTLQAKAARPCLCARLRVGNRPSAAASRPPSGAALAQPVEHRIRNAGVACSSHAGGTIPSFSSIFAERLRASQIVSNSLNCKDFCASTVCLRLSRPEAGRLIDFQRHVGKSLGRKPLDLDFPTRSHFPNMSPDFPRAEPRSFDSHFVTHTESQAKDGIGAFPTPPDSLVRR